MEWPVPEPEVILRMGKRELERQLAAALVGGCPELDAHKEACRLWREALKLVEFNTDGHHTYVTKSKHPLVQYWACKYRARVKEAWKQRGGEWTVLCDPGRESPPTLPNGERWEEPEDVWAVCRSTISATAHARLIQRLVSTEDTKEYEELRGDLSKCKYPSDILDAVPSPDR